MKYGNITNPSVDILKEIKTVHELDFDYVEIGAEGPQGDVRLLEARSEKIISAVKKFRAVPVIHTAWWMELGSPIESVRKAWLEEFKQLIRFSSNIGAEKVNTHSHSRGMFVRNDKNKKIVLDCFVKSLKESVKYAKQHGTCVVLENAAEKGEITKFNDFKYIVSRVPGLKVHLDVGHANINGGMKSVENFAFTFGKKIEHIHIHDNFGKRDDHMSLGKGNINFPRVAKILKEIGYDGTMTFEVFTKNRKDTAKSREYFKKLWVKA